LKGAGVKREQCERVLDKLVNSSVILITKDKGRAVYSVAEKRFDDPDQQILYQTIAAAGRKGVKKRDLLSKAGSQTRQWTKALNHLERGKVIRKFKSVKNKINIFYILYDLEPLDEHKGGFWYNNETNEIDEDLVSNLSKCALMEIRKARPYMNLRQVHNALQNSGLVKESIPEEAVQQLLNTLIYSGEIEIYEGAEVFYKPIFIRKEKLDGPSNGPTNGLTTLPCGVCPVFHLCGKTEAINPITCVYLTEWLQF